MSKGLLGKKIGMTRIFLLDSDKAIAGTAVEAGPCYILGIDNEKKKLVLGFSSVKESRLNKPQLGLFKKLGVPSLKFIREFPLEEGKEYKIGQELKADIFSAGDYVDVTGISIGKGFQGGVKRWHWHGGPKTHGSMSHRRVGSIGSSSDPSRVWKGHHMPGHMGFDQVTVQNLEVLKVDADNNLVLIKGAVPGHKNGLVLIKKALKKTKKVLKDQKAEVKKATETKKEAKKETKK